MLQRRDDEYLRNLITYSPNLAAAVVFAVLFNPTHILHFYQVFRTKTWFFGLFGVGGLFEFVGYIARITLAKQAPDYTLIPYIANSVLVLAAPSLLAISIYLVFGRIIELADGDRYLFLRRKWLIPFLVVAELIAFVLQGVGGGLISLENSDTRKTGSRLLVGAFFLQNHSLGIVIFTALIFHIRTRRQPTERSLSTPWQKHLFAIYTGCILIQIRSIARIVEFLVQGLDGTFHNKEVFLYLLDALPIFLVILLYNWIHPSEINMYLKGGASIAGIKLKRIETPTQTPMEEVDHV